MHTMIPAPKRVIRIEPMTRTQKRQMKRAFLETSYEVLNFLAWITIIVMIAAIAIMLKTS